ncbi:hypothetical protein GpartN1_g3994.t1 [Galdieria partita]|uniref:Uncharacterized protein n=1 Tax=Galdieria partita TaxID=83374 RepID=A0A9C7UQT2_9RHOD|nr:hypothetical protein GpartN1_g3994.t1 [Galdieria partita]
MFTFTQRPLLVTNSHCIRQQCTCCFQKRAILFSWKEKHRGNRSCLADRGLKVTKAPTQHHTFICMQQNNKGQFSGKAWWTGLLSGTILFALLIPYVANLKVNDVGLTEDDINWKLRQIPVFAVTDGEGKPFLLESSTNDKQRDGYFFVDKDDAVSFKELVTSQDSGVTPKIFPLTLDVAERFIQGKIDPNYVSSSDRFHLAPNVEDLEFADFILNSKFDRTDVPVFAVDKLRLEVQIPLHQDSDEKKGAVSEQVKRITPFFLKKNDLESLLTSAKKNSQNNVEPTIQVYKLSKLLTNLKRGEFGTLDDFIFYPPEESLEYIKQISSS